GNAGLQETNPTSVNRTIDAFHMPAAVASVVLQYRPSGNTGPFLSKVMNAVGGGEFAVSYDDIPNGSYEFILTALDSAGNVASLASAGGTASGTLSGTLQVRRGGSLPAVTADANALTLTPLKTSSYDAFGNVVRTTEYAKGAVSADAASYGVPAADAADEITTNFYDAYGHVVRTVDPEGAAEFRSYDVLGHIAKFWKPISNNDGQVNNAVQVFQYDPLGHQTATIEPSYLFYQPGVPLNPATYASSQVGYDAFGEIVSRGLNGGAQEYYQYDNAGRLWRTNEKDGVDKVLLYDLQGKNSAQILSQTLDLRNGYSTAAQVAALTSGVQRTETHYDALERVAAQAQQAFTVQRAGLEASPITLGMTNAALGVNAYSGAHYDAVAGSEGGIDYVWNPTSSISLSWNDISYLGAGNVYVEASYVRADGVATSYGQEFTSAAAAGGVSMSWQDFDYGSGAGYVYRVRVSKRDTSGNLVTLFDQGGSGGYSDFVSWAVPTQVGTAVNAQVRTSGSTTWNATPADNMGSRYVINTLGWSAGSYDAEVFYTRPGDASASAHSPATFSIHGGSGSLTSTTTVSGVVDVTIRPVVTQTVDRWGNAISVIDPRGYETDYRYNQLDKLIEEDKPLVDVWSANGTDTPSRPVTRNYYDQAGRDLGTVDANGNVAAARYDAAGQLVSEYHADGGVVSYQYDAFGRRVRTVDALGNVVNDFYDRDDRLVRETHPIGEENYAYDQAGNRIRVTNAMGDVTKYWYDTRGKMVRTQLPGGQQTNDFYDARGFRVRELTANNDQPVWSYDYFGRLLTHTDMGNGFFSYTYDRAGHMAQQSQTRGGATYAITTTYYENGLVKDIADAAVAGDTFYEYDAAGNRTRERYIKAGVTDQD